MKVPRSARSLLLAACCGLSGCSSLCVSFSPDGKEIAYSANQGSPLYIQEIGSSHPPRKFDVGDAYDLAWSPDSRSLAMTAAPVAFTMLGGDQTDASVSVLNLATGKARKLTTKIGGPLAWADDHTLVGSQANSIDLPSNLVWLNLSTGKIDRNVVLPTNVTHLNRIDETSSLLADSATSVVLIDARGAKPIAKEGSGFTAFSDGHGGGYVIKRSNDAPGKGEILYRWDGKTSLEPMALPRSATGISEDLKSYDSIVSISPSGRYLVVQHWDDLSAQPLLPRLIKMGIENKSAAPNGIGSKEEEKKIVGMLTSPGNKFRVDYRLVERETGKTSIIATRIDKLLPFAMVQAAWSPDERSLGVTSELSDVSEAWLIDPATMQTKTLVSVNRPGPFSSMIALLAAGETLENVQASGSSTHKAKAAPGRRAGSRRHGSVPHGGHAAGPTSRGRNNQGLGSSNLSR